MTTFKNTIKIAYLTAWNPLDKRSWSGTLYRMFKSLEKHCGNICPLGPVQIKECVTTKPWQTFNKYFPNKTYYCWNSIPLALDYAKTFEEKLKNQHFDLIFAPIASTEISFLNTEIPIIYLSDATFNLLVNYYPQYSSLLDISILEGNMLEKLALTKSSLILYPTEWAANSAINDYGIDSSKIHIVPFGANLDYTPPSELILNRKKTDICRLLFMGVDWYRKGGNIAFDTLINLEKLGINSQLTVCGCTPPPELDHKNLKVIPFLNKNNANDAEKLYNLYLNSDFLILPTKAECFGIVFAEASAFGLPILTSLTGGIPYVVENFQNGFTLPKEALGIHYANVISKIYTNDDLYYKLIQSSREIFDKKLNWDNWGLSVANLIKKTFNL